MSIREGTDKRVSFNARDELGDKIDKLTMVMSKLAATDSHKRRLFRPQIYKSGGQNRSYNQGGYQPRSNTQEWELWLRQRYKNKIIEVIGPRGKL